MLNPLATDLWDVTQPLRFLGTPVGCRMTCVRLASGAVLVHSPVRATAELHAAVEDLGPVTWLVAPNALHHLFIDDWRERFPEAKVLVAPKLRRKKPSLAAATPLTQVPAEWGSELEVLAIDGIPFVDEFVLFHRASATLIVTDLAFNFDRHSPFLTRWFIRFTGRLGQLAPTMTERLMVRNRKALRASLLAVLEWPFERVVVSHGNVVESGGREALASGFDWLLK